MVLISTFSSVIFLSFQEYFLLRNNTLAFENYSCNILKFANNILVGKNKSSGSRANSRLPIFECLAAKPVMFSRHVHTILLTVSRSLALMNRNKRINEFRVLCLVLQNLLLRKQNKRDKEFRMLSMITFRAT